MINILKVPFRPKTCCWIHEPGAGQTLLAVTDMDTPTIRIYDGRGDGKPLYELDKLHRAPVHLMAVGRFGAGSQVPATSCCNADESLVHVQVRLCHLGGRAGFCGVLAAQ
jgi:hypothetical protein